MKLVYSIKEIQYLNQYFKTYSEELNESDFLNEEILSLLNKSPAMHKGFVSSYRSGKYLQPGYLTEINVCATIANMMELYYDYNISEPNLRHQYSNGKIFLKEYGGCGMSDIQLVSEDGSITTIEVKEPLSLGGDYDLGITEEGKLFPKISAKRTFPDKAQKILDSFNEVDSVFNHIGHNIPLSNIDYLKAILTDYLGDKQIDYIASYSEKGELIYFPACEIFDHVDFKGSEIRTAGKNSIKVYTPKAFKAAMDKIDCTINDNGVVAIPKDKAGFRVARCSKNVVSGIKINSIFYFKLEDITEDDNFYYADIKKAQQVKQSISVHLNLK